MPEYATQKSDAPYPFHFDSILKADLCFTSDLQVFLKFNLDDHCLKKKSALT